MLLCYAGICKGYLCEVDADRVGFAQLLQDARDHVEGDDEAQHHQAGPGHNRDQRAESYQILPQIFPFN